MASQSKYPVALPPDTILAGQYIVEEVLGQGGFGITYRVRDYRTKMPFAVKEFFPEFQEHEPYCRFQGCMHIHEPDCGVKDAVEQGQISRARYDSYLQLVQELSDSRKQQ